MAKPIGRENQPLAEVKWIERDKLRANNYNPNRVAKPELELLKRSILEDGWTQPIVARPDFEIVDGFHRWTVSADPEIAEMTDGLVPVVFLKAVVGDAGHQMMSTIRHNRARGQHIVLSMADIVRSLIDDHGLTFEEVQERLGMEFEEVDRLYDASGMPARAKVDGFNHGWIPDR